MNAGKKIALGVTSSVSIYKACEVLRGFGKAGVGVRVVMTANAASGRPARRSSRSPSSIT